jgi:hypothetical protein
MNIKYDFYFGSEFHFNCMILNLKLFFFVLLALPSLLSVSLESVEPVWNTVAGGNNTNATEDGSSELLASFDGFWNLFFNLNWATFFGGFNLNNGNWWYGLESSWTGYISRSNSNYGNAYAGLNSGFCLGLSSGPSVLHGFIFTTSNGDTNSDPLNITIEGTNDNNLNLGASWHLIYSGRCGLDSDPGRLADGTYQATSNSVAYKSYRILITSKRGSSSDCVSYGRVKLYGY